MPNRNSKANIIGIEYTIYGYKGKQVRDNIHSLDVARFINAFFQDPRFGEVYNIGGGRDNSTSILEAFDRVAAITGKAMKYQYSEINREGDHMCYISDLSKMKDHYPNWGITKSLQTVFEEIVMSWNERIKVGVA
ncbi:MAG: CDP-paratose 2-epimerase [Candidatus Endobugula sp.]|jgi:CDP-paratose 2-epimerase